MAYSYDGIVWFINSSGNAAFLNYCVSIAYNGTLFVAGGGEGPSGGVGTTSIATSPDGITWTQNASGSALVDTGVYAVATNGIMWVAGGTGTNKMAYSYDGFTWTAATGSLFTTICIGIAWNGTYWLAFGSGTNSVIYSTDGISWSASTSGNSVFSAGNSAGSRKLPITPPLTKPNPPQTENFTVACGNAPYPLIYSYDGINWLPSITSSALFTNTNAVAWNGTLWIAAGGGTSTLAYSSDGLNWVSSASGTALFSSLARSVAWNGTLWVACGSGTYELAYSNDGIQWTGSSLANTIFGGGSPMTIAWNGIMWLAGGNSSVNTLAYSYDGILWTPTPLSTSVFSTACNSIAWNGTRWIAGGIGTSALATSTDGINWTPVTSNFTSAYSIGWNGSLWTAGGLGPSRLAYSSNGLTWVDSASGNSIISTFCSSLVWNGAVWLAGTSDAVPWIIYSADGIRWAPATSANNFFTVSMGGGCQGLNSRRLSPWSYPQPNPLTENFTIAGGIGTNVMAYTYDGKIWHSNPSALTVFGDGECNGIAWNGSLWVVGAASNGSRLAYSTDGINWTSSSSASALLTNSINTVIWSGSLWLACGHSFTPGPTTNKIIHSYDGINWYASASQVSALSTTCSGLAWNGKAFVGIGSEIVYSTNGLDWAAVPGIFTGAGRCVAANNTIWVAGGSGTYSLGYSYDGQNWVGSVPDSGIINDCLSVSWNGSLWVAVGTGTNSLIYSSDGINWTVSSSGTALFPGGAASVSWNGSFWLAGGPGPTYLAYSYDGITWIPSPAPASALFTAAVTGFGSRRVAPYTSAQNQIETESSAELTVVANPIDIDCSSTNNYILTLTTSTTVQLINAPSWGRVYTLKIFVVQDITTGSHLITWPVSVLWGTAGQPILSTTPGITDIIELITYNSGTTWFGIFKGIGFL